MTVTQCRICGNSQSNPIYTVREMMFGLKEQFDYFQCSYCECLQILNIPQDMSRYYPSNYYSFSGSSTNPIVRLARRMRDRYAFYGKGCIGKVIHEKYPEEGLQALSKIPLNKNHKILEVGCGGGKRLYALKELGFKNLTGIDPYLKNEIRQGQLKIINIKLEDLDEKWDVIFLYHSFEHRVDPFKTLQAIKELLNVGGHCMISIPIVSSYAWKHYNINWVQLDVPRHFHLHSVKSLTLLAEKVGLHLGKTIYDSTEFQFWGSEQYLKEIPLQSDRSYCVNPSESIFQRRQIKSYRKEAEKLNLKNQGDQATFYLTKK